MDITDRVTRILAEQALMDVAEVTPDKTLEDLGIDSLGLVETIFAIEEDFDIQIPFNANTPTENDFDLSTVAAIIVAVRALVVQQAE
jgi:acyl carrier protein